MIPCESLSLVLTSGRQQVCCSVHQDIRNFVITLGEDDFPCFLWEGENPNVQDLNKGFLRGEILVYVCDLYQLIHPCSPALTDNVGRLTRAQSRRER